MVNGCLDYLGGISAGTGGELPQAGFLIG